MDRTYRFDAHSDLGQVLMFYSPDRYINGVQVDATYEQEIREFISTPSTEERALAAYEKRSEFLPSGSRAEDRRERAYTRMESDVDLHEKLLHPPSKPEQIW